MSRNTKIALLAGAVVIVVIAFVALRPRGDSGSNPDAAGTVATTEASSSPEATVTNTKPAIATITVRNGKPVGGVKKIEVDEGDRIRFRVTDDSAGEVHLHGYDVEKEVGPGNPASFNVKATITGRFEVELHPATQVAEVTVNP